MVNRLTSPAKPLAGAGRAVIASLSLALASATAVAAQAIDSAYSTLEWQDACIVIDRPAEGEPGGWAQLACQGHAGYPVFVADDDQRMSLAYGFAGGPGRWESFSSFNRVNESIEWRLTASPTGRRPFATIHRWFVSDRQDGERQVLVISTVAQPDGGESCVAAYVDAQANSQANHLARRVADEVARGFRCGADEPRYHGATTPRSPQPVRAER